MNERRWGSIVTPIHGPVPEGKPPWRDNAYISFWDAESSVFGAFHVSTSPNSEGRRARFSISAGGRTAELVEPLEPGTWTSNSVSFDGRGSIAVRSAEVDADFEIGALYPEYDYTTGGVIPALGEEAPLHHVEQIVTVVGNATVRGAASDVNGRGFRDRSWGYRDESQSIAEYFSISATFRDFGLTVLSFLHPDGSVHNDGHVFTSNGPSAQVQDVGIMRDASGLMSSVSLTLSDTRVLNVSATTRHAGFWIPMGVIRRGPAMSAYDEFLSFDEPSVGSGLGLAEHGTVRKLF